MKLSLFDSARDNVPKQTIKNVSDFFPHRYDIAAKLRVPAISPALYEPGATRSNANVTALSCWLGDFDDLSEEDALDVIKRAKALGWSGAVYTTYSHASKEDYRFRVWLELDRLVRPDEWPEVWQALNHRLGDHCDPKCTDLARIYFIPAAPPGTEEHNWYIPLEGTPVPVDALFAPVSQRLTRDQLKGLSRALRQRTSAHAIACGHAINRVAKGEAFAEPGNIDNTIFQLTSVIAEKYPEVSPESVGDMFAASLQLMAAEHPQYAMTPEAVAMKFSRHLKDNRSKEQKAQEKEISDLRLRLEQSGMDRLYTEEELANVHPRHWIIRRGKSFYIRVGDSYRGPYTADDAPNAAYDLLAPADTVVELDTFSRGERRPKTLVQLVKQYGSVAAKVRVDISAQKAHYDQATRTMVEAPCPRREIASVYHAEVDEWLNTLAKDRYHQLCSWLAALPDTRNPLTILFLTGPPAVGKSFLTVGGSRVFSDTGVMCSLSEALGEFNETLLLNPIVFADEYLPKDNKGNPKYQELKEFIQAKQRTLRRKYLTPAELVGCHRVIVAANNESILATAEQQTNHDISASMDRFLHIPCSPEAAAYLKDHPEHFKWIENDTIAQHIMWLHDNYEWQPNGRFQVHHHDEELHAKLTMASGIRGSVGQWCLGYLQNPSAVDRDVEMKGYALIQGGHLYVNIKAVVDSWGIYVQNARCPSTGVLSTTLRAMSHHERINGRDFRRIDIAQLHACAEFTNWCSREDVDTALSNPTLKRLSKDMN